MSLEQKNKDIAETEIFNGLFDEFYSYTPLKNFKRSTTLDEQYSGIDLNFCINGRYITCDEKIAKYYINQELNTFILELYYKALGGDGGLKTGWFLDEKHTNEYLAIFWIPKAINNEPKCLNEVIHMQFCLVKVLDIKNFLTEKHLHHDKLVYIGLDLSINKSNSKKDFYDYYGKDNDVRIKISNTIAEQPVNIIFPKEWYKEIATCWYEWKNGQFIVEVDKLNVIN